MKNFFIIGIFFIFLSIFSISSFAQQPVTDKQEIKEEEISVKYPQAEIKKSEIKKIEPALIKTFFITEVGIDSNPYLDSSKKADLFNREILDFRIRRNLPRSWVFNLDYRPSATIYRHERSVSFYDNFLTFNFENYPVNWIVLRFEYEFDFIYYPKLKNSNYFSHGPGFQTRLWFTKNIYQEIGINLSLKEFTKRKASDLNNVSTLVRREDNRPIFSYEIGQYFKRSLLKFYTKHYENNSNDEYFDFYDYKSHQFNVAFIHMFNEKFYYLADLGFERRDYNSRPSDINILGSSAQKDDIYKVNMSLFYDINKNLTVDLSWSWRQSASNSINYEYAGYITSCGLHYRF